MTNTKDLEQMLAVCNARYALRQQDFAKLVAEENRLRAELARLDQMQRDAQPDGLSQIHLQAIGADLIWQSWLNRSRVSINMALAQVLSQKERHLHDVRQAYGKVLVVEQLLKKAALVAQRKRTHAALDQTIEMSVLPDRQ